MAERRELSTPHTWAYRWLIPAALTVVAIGVITDLLLMRDGPLDVLVLLGGVTMAGAALILARIFDRAKRVWLKGNTLIYAAYGKEYQMDVTTIEQVVQTPWFRPHRIRICFSSKTPFGNSILFFPPLSVKFFAEHPAVEELRRSLEHI